jgi:hypothetical protein
MTDTTIVAVPPAQAQSYVDWGPIIGGALLTSALSFVLFSFGSAAGIASVSPYSWNNPSATTMSVVAVAWFVVVMIGSFLLGGYFAGRLRRPAGDAGASERETRDGAHGLIVWALGLLLGAWLAFLIAGAALRATATAAGAAGGAAAASMPSDRIAGYIDNMLRTAPRPADAQGAGRAEDPRAEISRIMTSSIARGSISAEDRTYVVQLVAARTGLSEDEVRRRVDAAIEEAKSAANAARKMAAILAFLIGASSLFAAGAAYWGATAGGRHRDEAMMLRG